jgi:hypothetical protein
MLAQRLNTALLWLADRSLLGLLICLGALPVITAPAALAAAAAASRCDNFGDSVRVFWLRYRAVAIRSLAPGSLGLVLLASVAVAALIAAASPAGWGRALIVTTGMVTAAAAILLICYAAICLDVGVSPSPANSLRVAIGSGASTVRLLGLYVILCVTVALAAVAALPLLGVLAWQLERVAQDARVQIA